MNYVIPEEDDFLELLSNFKRMKERAENIPIDSLETIVDGTVALDGQYEMMIDRYHEDYLRMVKHAGRYDFEFLIWDWDTIDTGLGGKATAVYDGRINVRLNRDCEQDGELSKYSAVALGGVSTLLLVALIWANLFIGSLKIQSVLLSQILFGAAVILGIIDIICIIMFIGGVNMTSEKYLCRD